MVFKAPSTRIRIFFNPQLFLSGFKKFPVHTQRIQIEFARPHASDGIRIHSSTQGSSALNFLQSMRRRARQWRQWREICSVRPDTLFRHIGLLFGERLDTLFMSSDSKISGFTRPHVIGFVADLFFPLWRADLIFPDSLSNSPDACGWQPYPERKSCGFQNIRIRVHGA